MLSRYIVTFRGGDGGVVSKRAEYDTIIPVRGSGGWGGLQTVGVASMPGDVIEPCPVQAGVDAGPGAE